MVASERVVRESNAEEKTGPVEGAGNPSYAFSFCRRRVASMEALEEREFLRKTKDPI
jgi:hypothetical protein